MNNLPTPQEQAFNLLEWYSDILHKKEYVEIKNIIKEAIRRIPVAIAIVRKGAFIERIRINDGETLYYREEDISYIKDEEVIKNHLTKFGRANKPHEVLFYGAIKSSEIPQERATALMETAQILRDKEAVNIKGQLYTLGRWEVLEDFEVAEMVFCDEAIESNPDTKKAYEFQLKKLEKDEMKDFMLRLIKFFSSQYARKVEDHNFYKISVAYSDLLLNEANMNGIAFPSVQSGYKGQNIVLKPEAVDKYLKLNLVSTLKVHKNKMKAVVNNHKNSLEFGKNNSKFIWKDTNSKDIATQEQINIQLGIK